MLRPAMGVAEREAKGEAEKEERGEDFDGTCAEATCCVNTVQDSREIAQTVSVRGKCVLILTLWGPVEPNC